MKLPSGSMTMEKLGIAASGVEKRSLGCVLSMKPQVLSHWRILAFQGVWVIEHTKNAGSRYGHILPYSLTSNFATAEVTKSFLYLALIFQIPYLWNVNNQTVFKMKINDEGKNYYYCLIIFHGNNLLERKILHQIFARVQCLLWADSLWYITNYLTLILNKNQWK